MLDIKVLAQLKNYTLVQDKITGNIHLYSYNKCIAIYDGKIHCSRQVLSGMSKMHLSWFKDFIGGN